MLEIRSFNYDHKLLKGKTVIHYYDVKSLDAIEKAIQEKKKIIPLDNGCYVAKKHKRYDFKKTGNLCCLAINTMELITQKNIE